MFNNLKLISLWTLQGYYKVYTKSTEKTSYDDVRNIYYR